jgi:hypothetical protein
MLYKVVAIFMFGFALYLLAIVLVDIHQHSYRYPEWTPEQKEIIKRVINRRRTVVRVGMNQFYVIEHNKEAAK